MSVPTKVVSLMDSYEERELARIEAARQEANLLDDRRVAWMRSKDFLTTTGLHRLNAEGRLPGFSGDSVALKTEQAQYYSGILFRIFCRVVLAVVVLLVTLGIIFPAYQHLMSTWAQGMLMRP